MRPTEGRVILRHKEEVVNVGGQDYKVSGQSAGGILIPQTFKRRFMVKYRENGTPVLVSDAAGTQFKRVPDDGYIYTLIRESDIWAELPIDCHVEVY